jgi:hypothetical protein
LAAQLVYDYGTGSSDSSGDYAGLGGARVHDGTLGLGAGFRPFERLQVHASMPFRVQYRDLGGLESKTATRLGDSSLALRYMLSDEPMAPIAADPASWLPFLELIAGVTAPSGRAPEDSNEPSGADITGNGYWMVSAGAKLSRRVSHDDALTFAALYGYTSERSIELGPGASRDFDPGNELNLRLNSWHALNVHWAFGLLSTFRLTGKAREDGALVADSSLHRLRFGGFVDHYLSYPNLQLTTNLLFDPPFDGFSRNVPFTSATLAFLLSYSFDD